MTKRNDSKLSNDTIANIINIRKVAGIKAKNLITRWINIMIDINQTWIRMTCDINTNQ